MAFLFGGAFISSIAGWKTLAEWFIVGIVMLAFLLLPFGMIIESRKPKKKLDYDEDDIREQLMN